MQWEKDFEIRVHIDNGAVTISANRAGLLSLSSLLAELADEPPGNHYHLDPFNALEDGSSELILDKLK